MRRLSGIARSPAVIVGAIVAVSAWLTARQALRVDDWFVMTDELLYVKIAASFGEDPFAGPQLHGEYWPLFNLLFPVLFAPFVKFMSMPAAFEAGHALNAFLMASTAIPAYLLVRALALPRLAGYLVAAMTVAVPWLGMSMILWTEAAAYPAFTWAIFLMHRALVAPGTRNDLLAVGGLALAFVGRTQFLFLAGVLPVAVLLYDLRHGPKRYSPRHLAAGLARALRARRVLLAAYGLLALGALVLAVRSGLDTALGSYSTTADGDIWPEGTWAQAERHLAVTTVALGVVPLVLGGGWALSSVFRPSRPELHAFALLVVLSVPAIVLMASSFTLRFAGGALQDRYIFFIAPLLFAAMVACVLDRRGRWLGIAAAGLGFYAIADQVTYETGTQAQFFASPSTWFWSVLDGQSYELGARLGIAHLSPLTVVRVGTLAITIVLAVLVAWRPARRALLLATALPVLAFCALETNYVLPRGAGATGGGAQASGAPALDTRDWVDEALDGDGDVAIVPTFVGNDGFVTERVWWNVEFWNKRVNRAYAANESGGYTIFPAETMTVDFASGRVTAEEQFPFLVVSRTERRFGLAAERSLAKDYLHLELIEPRRPYRAAWTTQNIGEDGWTDGGEPARLRLHDAPGEGRARRVTLVMAVTADLPARRHFRVTGGARPAAGVIEVEQERKVVTRACVPPGGSTDVELRLRESSVLPDGRPVGLRIMQIGVVPDRRRDCG